MVLKRSYDLVLLFVCGQVVAQQLNFIERNFSTVSSQDQESDFTMAGSDK